MSNDRALPPSGNNPSGWKLPLLPGAAGDSLSCFRAWGWCCTSKSPAFQGLLKAAIWAALPCYAWSCGVNQASSAPPPRGALATHGSNHSGQGVTRMSSGSGCESPWLESKFLGKEREMGLPRGWGTGLSTPLPIVAASQGPAPGRGCIPDAHWPSRAGRGRKHQLGMGGNVPACSLARAAGCFCEGLCPAAPPGD